ncbi:MAG: IclR family transcriptional regulator [Lachnospiraceae bacterium]
MKDDIKTIQSVQRAIDIMNCVGDAGRKITLNEISSKLELNINTTRGLVQTLLANGFLSKDVEQGTYTLGFEFLTKSKLVYQLQIQRIRDIAFPDMERISEKYGVSSWLQTSFYRGIYTVEILEAPGSHYSYAPKSGANLPLHASASGKLRIAYMPELERKKILDSIVLEPLTEHTITDREKFAELIERAYSQGYATELEETDIGISSVAAPFFDAHGTLGGTLSVAAPSVKLNRILSNVVIDLKRAGMRITDSISTRRRT